MTVVVDFSCRNTSAEREELGGHARGCITLNIAIEYVEGLSG